MGNCETEKCKRCRVQNCPISALKDGDDEQAFIYMNHEKLAEVFHQVVTNYQFEGMPEEVFMMLMGSMVKFILEQKKYYDDRIE